MLKSCSICSHSILASFVCFLFGQMQIGFRLCLRLQFRSQIIFSFLLFSHNFGLFILVLNSCFLLSLSFLESIKGDLRVSVPLTLILISKVYPVSKLFFLFLSHSMGYLSFSLISTITIWVWNAALFFALKRKRRRINRSAEYNL